MKTDLDIAKKAKLKPITAIAAKLGIVSKYLESYGPYKAKVSLDALKTIKPGRSAKYIVVTGITPTHLGEGKTITTIGLSMALNRLGKKAVSCIRQPSMGPFFGIKGGGTGGGYCQVLPAEDISIHFTGDIHAVTQAHNLCSSFIGNHIYRGNKLNIDTKKIFWKRVLDVNDRSLRNVRINVGEARPEAERDTGFDITAASELMAILALSQSLQDLRKRISRIVVALTKAGKVVTCEDLKVAGAMTLILKDALKPNLVQTTENTPCFVHTGPFANITHGNSSIIADKLGLGLCDFVITESGFGADCGAEKFFDIKCRESRLRPNAAVLVCSVRALKIHSGIFKMTPGHPLDRNLMKENLNAVEMGCVNLEKQIDNVRLFGVPCIVAINRFDTDTDREINMIKRAALHSGAFECVVSDLYKYGSRGGMELAVAVMRACQGKNSFSLLYPDNMGIKEKIEIIAKKVYGAKSVHYEAAAEENIAIYKKLKFNTLPICMAKTHLSLSHDPNLKGRPRNFALTIRDVKPSIGAGFLYALCGKIMTMPALPSKPAGERIDIDPKGRLTHVHR